MAGKTQELNPYTKTYCGTSGGAPLNINTSKMFTHGLSMLNMLPLLPPKTNSLFECLPHFINPKNHLEHG